MGHCDTQWIQVTRESYMHGSLFCGGALKSLSGDAVQSDHFAIHQLWNVSGRFTSSIPTQTWAVANKYELSNERQMLRIQLGCPSRTNLLDFVQRRHTASTNFGSTFNFAPTVSCPIRSFSTDSLESTNNPLLLFYQTLVEKFHVKLN